MPEKINASHDDENIESTTNEDGTETIAPQDDAAFAAALGKHGIEVRLANIVAASMTAQIASSVNKNDPAGVVKVFEKIDQLMAIQPEGGPSVLKAAMWGFAHALIKLDAAGLLPKNDNEIDFEDPELHRGHGEGCDFDPENPANQ